MIRRHPEPISSVTQFVDRVLQDSSRWSLKGPPWFRGQTETVDPPDAGSLLPKVLQSMYRDRENELIQVFRMRAQQYGATPEFSRIDQWLFLMQHCGLPTRLLDWTEGALMALYFAINRFEPKKGRVPVVWMLNPVALNLLATGVPGFSLTWLGYRSKHPVPISNLVAAFQNDDVCQSAYPIAVYPQPVHPRVTAQRGTFTIHGADKRSLDQILLSVDNKTLESVVRAGLRALTPKGRSTFQGVEPRTVLEDYKRGDCLTRYEIDCSDTAPFLRHLRSLGISQSTLFPEFDGLAGELSRIKSDIF